MLYLDSSAIVKRYVAEAGSAEVRAAIADDPHVATAVISHTEVRAALVASVAAGGDLRFGTFDAALARAAAAEGLTPAF